MFLTVISLDFTVIIHSGDVSAQSYHLDLILMVPFSRSSYQFIVCRPSVYHDCNALQSATAGILPSSVCCVQNTLILKYTEPLCCRLFGMGVKLGLLR